jgi:hypothetical protein
MILPAAIDRWAERPNASPSFFQEYVCGMNAEAVCAAMMPESSSLTYAMATDARTFLATPAI